MQEDPAQTETHTESRRPIRARGSRWAPWLATTLARAGVTPNAVSIASTIFALLGCICFVLSPHMPSALNMTLLILAPLCILSRLICNLLDGMIAVEGGKGTPTGAIYNDFPDRISDTFFFAGAGYAVAGTPLIETLGPILGWSCAALAIIVAYARVLGASLGAEHDFRGLMAKPQRMAVLASGSIVAAIDLAITGSTFTLALALLLIALGCMVTTARRLQTLARTLQATGTEAKT